MTDTQGKNSNFWMGFFLGGLFGALIIFVMGTKKGKKILELFIDRTEEYEENIEEKIARLQKKGEDLLHEAETVKKNVITNIEHKKQNVSDALVNRVDEALTKIEDIQKKGVSLTEEVHRNYFHKNGKPLSS